MKRGAESCFIVPRSVDTYSNSGIIRGYNPHVLDMGCRAPLGALAFSGVHPGENKHLC